jgi:hypothetical protein
MHMLRILCLSLSEVDSSIYTAAMKKKKLFPISVKNLMPIGSVEEEENYYMCFLYDVVSEFIVNYFNF